MWLLVFYGLWLEDPTTSHSSAPCLTVSEKTLFMSNLPVGMMSVNFFDPPLTLQVSHEMQPEILLYGWFVSFINWNWTLLYASSISLAERLLPSNPFIISVVCKDIALPALSNFEEQEVILQWFPWTGSFPVPHNRCSQNPGLLIPLFFQDACHAKCVLSPGTDPGWFSSSLSVRDCITWPSPNDRS